MSDDVAIKIDSVSKDFLLPHERTQSIKTAFISTLKGRRNKTKEQQRALQDISFEIKKGEFFGIVGRNGSGKSTLLKILAQIYQPTKGSVSVSGRLVPFIELGVGFNPELTGRDNVYLSSSLLGFSKSEIDAMYDKIVGFAELEKFMDQKLKNYSSGMQVRLAFSVAIQADADILLIDEVLAVGDAAFQRKCFEYFKKLKRDKKTVVFVSHDMSAIREYCDKGILIEDSKLILAGTADQIATRYNNMFTEDSHSTQETVGERWGNGAATIESIAAEIRGNKLRIVQKVTAKKEIVDPIVGFRLRDAAGKDVLGTNTKIEKKKIGTLQPGKSVAVTWMLPNVLSDGTYIIDPSVLFADSVTVADWWDEAASVVVKRERRFPYAVDPGYTVTIEN